MPVARLQVSDVDDWLGRLRRAGVGDGSIRNQLQTLRSALTQAMRWGWIGQNPARLASDHRAKRTPRDVMAVEEVQKVLSEAQAVHEMAPIAFRLAAITRGSQGRARRVEVDRSRR